MIFISDDRKFSVEITPTIFAQIKYYSNCANRKETGGILIGKYTDDLSRAIISLVSGPPSDSKSGRTWFIRGINGLRKLLDKCYKSAGSYYLGEWHFHPFASPSPSTQDIQQMLAIAKDRKYNCPEPIMIILGGDPNTNSATLYICVFQRSGSIIHLSNISDGIFIG